MPSTPSRTAETDLPRAAHSLLALTTTVGTGVRPGQGRAAPSHTVAAETRRRPRGRPPRHLFVTTDATQGSCDSRRSAAPTRHAKDNNQPVGQGNNAHIWVEGVGGASGRARGERGDREDEGNSGEGHRPLGGREEGGAPRQLVCGRRPLVWRPGEGGDEGGARAAAPAATAASTAAATATASAAEAAEAAEAAAVEAAEAAVAAAVAAAAAAVGETENPSLLEMMVNK